MNLPNPVDRHVGDRIRSRRVALGISPEFLADALGATVQQAQQWEAGTSRVGSTRLLELAKILDVDSAFFFSDAQSDGQHGKAESDEPLPLSVLRTPPALEGLRLVRGFARIENRAFREVVIKLVETMAAETDCVEHDASLFQSR
jgi:transcriptional regulator with XRE-family HTH domain